MSTPPSSGTSGVPEEPPDRVGQLYDLVSYVLTVTAVFVTVSAVGGLLFGAAIAPGVKYGLFVLGWLTFGYGTLLLLPDRPWKDDDETDIIEAQVEGEDSEFQAFVQQLPPARFRQLEPERRLPTGLRLFLASLFVLAVSIVLEQAFGVGP